MTIDEFLVFLKERTEVFEKEEKKIHKERIESGDREDEEIDLEISEWLFVLEDYVRRR